jgi:hypothetical protein
MPPRVVRKRLWRRLTVRWEKEERVQKGHRVSRIIDER